MTNTPGNEIGADKTPKPANKRKPKEKPEAAVGSKVTVRYDDGREVTYELVADQKDHGSTPEKIGPAAPLHRELLGKEPGQTFTVPRAEGVIVDVTKLS